MSRTTGSILSKATFPNWNSSLNEYALETNYSSYRIENCFNNDDLYLAKHIPSGNYFALRKTNLDKIDQLKFIINEIRVTKMLRHVNLLPFLASFVHQDHLYTITPLAEYGSISELSKPTGLSEAAISFVIKDVLDGLDYLHKRGIIHRAIRGSHILVTGSNGRCIISGLQYSISVLKEGKWQNAIHSYPKNAEKNLNWLAPEVLEQNLMGYNSKSDIYSLGIVCCELANGCIPFEDLQPTEMLLDKLTGNFPRPLDSTCEEITRMPIHDMTEDIKQKYMQYKNRTFSSAFHSFTVDLCLHFDPEERPTAQRLLNHNFIKQAKKASSSTNLLNLIPNIKHLIEKLSPDFIDNNKNKQIPNSDLNQDLNWNFSCI